MEFQSAIDEFALLLATASGALDKLIEREFQGLPSQEKVELFNEVQHIAQRLGDIADELKKDGGA